MKPRTARLLASLLVDEWPIPKWLALRLRRSRDVGRELDRAARLERTLQDSSRGKASTFDVAPPPIERGERGGVHALAIAMAATAATTIAIGILWYQTGREAPNQNIELVASNTRDATPILASLSAGQTMATRISTGLQNVAVRIADASDQLGSRIPGHLFEDAQHEMEDSSRE